jgi:YVTN family beta-propeller protein
MTHDPSRRAPRGLVLLAALLLGCLVAAPGHASSFTLFESGQVRPLALSPDGARLFVTNTPDNRLEIFDVGPGGLTRLGSVPVGLEPVAVATRTNDEVWVVNHLSDSVSIIDVTNPAAARVVRTLLVGDEPRDIVFGGPAKDRAFITTAHRGQNTPYQQTIHTVLATPGIGRADVWVFDAGNLGATLGGTPMTIVTLFGDTPRALAVTPDGNTVYAAIFHSGNRTTTLSEGAVCDGGAGASPCVVDGLTVPGGLPAPNTDHTLLPQPEVGLIVKFDGAHWKDELGRDWDNAVRFSLPDKDVFAIDASQNPPVATSVVSGVGTVLFNMAVNPVSGKVYVANTDAQNAVRFEGTGVFSALFKPFGEPASVRGHLTESRITVIDGATVAPRHLNKHIDYGTCCAPDPSENAKSLAFPLGMAVASDGATLYVAAFGSGKIGIFDTAQLESDTFVPSTANEIALTGLGACPGGSCGPTGLVLDETYSRLYVLTRFDDGISVVSTATGAEEAHVALHNPEPANVVSGRRFNYDASLTSSHGDSACASCHIFADLDSLAWDLGDPDGDLINNPGPFAVGPFPNPPAVYEDFHPLKGPMTTQSLRGMANHGPMHWRGDRTGGNDAPSVQPDSGTFDEDAAFKKFNVAFPGLLGRSSELQPAEMQAYTDFILQVTYPPNPIRALDNSLTFAEQAGRNFFKGPISDTLQNCDGCHRLLPTANASSAAPGFFGSDGRYSFEGESQHLKIPHLRNMYQKVGMFGMPAVSFFNPGDNGFKGDQIRGFGFIHDGSVDTLFRFHNAIVFNQSPANPTGIPAGPAGDPLRRQIEAFMMAFDSNLAPIVGQQVTRTSTNAGATNPRIDLLVARANAGECDLVAKGRLAGVDRGAVYIGGGDFLTDRVADPPIVDATLRALASTSGQEITYTCVPPGSGVRLGIDRDDDGFADRDEIEAGSDPADPASTPSGVDPVCGTVTSFVFKRASLKDRIGRLLLQAKDLPIGSYAQESVAVSAFDDGGAIFGGSVAGASIIPKGSAFKFAAARGSTGITRLTVKQNRRSPGLFKITLRTKEAWSPPLADEGVATTEVILKVGSQCFRGNATLVLP